MKRILVAEDSHPIRLRIFQLLNNEGYEVDMAENGDEAFKRIEQLAGIDLLVTDIRMPILDGYGLLQKLHEKNYQFPVIVHAAFFDKSEVKYSGRIEHLSKLGSKIEDVVQMAKSMIGNPA